MDYNIVLMRDAEEDLEGLISYLIDILCYIV